MTKMYRLAAAMLLSLLGALPLFGAGAKDSITLALIPDGLSLAQKMPLQTYLTEQMGRNVKLMTPESYADTLEGLSNGSIDFALLGALTYVRARAKFGVVPLVQRPSDLQFHSAFIAGAGTSIHALKDLKGKKFAFGDVSSTSGHLMPYLELRQAGLNPDTDLEFRYSREHPATVKLVELGVVDAGAVDESVLNAMIKDGRADRKKLRVIHVSKPFVDYVFAARKGVSEAERQKFAEALLELREGTNDDVLRILRADRFIKANDEEYATVREVARELKMF